MNNVKFSLATLELSKWNARLREGAVLQTVEAMCAYQIAKLFQMQRFSSFELCQSLKRALRSLLECTSLDTPPLYMLDISHLHRQPISIESNNA